MVVCAIDRRVDYPPRSPYEYYRFFLEDLGLVGLAKHPLVEHTYAESIAFVFGVGFARKGVDFALQVLYSTALFIVSSHLLAS